MALISPATLEQIRAASDIVEIIGAVLPLKRAGQNFVGLCPFHREKTPSFNVHPQRQSFHCFGCHKGGDVFTFIKEYENVSFFEAVKRLAERARIPLQLSAGEEGRHFQKETLLQIHEQLAQRWHAALLNDAAAEPARAYLAKRKVPAEAIELFRLGYALDQWDDTVNWSKSKNFDLSLVETAGLIIPRETGGGYYDRFRGRLMFPICDEQGRVIAFSGRILSADEKTAKYVNSPETPLFTKSKVFFGLDKSKRAILDAGAVLICEGQLDLIACFMADVKNVVAPQGTAFTPEHARILKRYANEAILSFDADAAGQNAAVRVLDSLLAVDMAVRVLTLPAPHDPDSFIKEFGAEAFRQRVNQTQGFFDFYLDRLAALHDLKTDKGRMALLNAYGEAILKTGNVVMIDTYSQKAASRLGVSADSIRAEFKKLQNRRTPHSPAEPEEEQPVAPEIPRPSTQEFWLLKIALLFDDQLPWLHLHLDLSWVQNPVVRRILELRMEQLAQGDVPPAVSLLTSLPEPGASALLSEALAENRTIPNPAQQLHDLVLKLRNEFYDRTLTQIVQRSTAPDLSDQDRNQVLQEQLRLRELKRHPLHQLGEM